MQLASTDCGPVFVYSIAIDVFTITAEILALPLANIYCYNMALSHKDWELPNSRIWLAKTDIDRGLDFLI